MSMQSQIPQRPKNIEHESEPEALPYFHGLFSNKDEIADLMLPYLHNDSCYLLRNSSDLGPGNYTLSISHGSGIKHIRIFRTNNTFYLEDGAHFSTVQKLIEHYGNTDIPNIENVQGVRLKYPILRPKPIYFEPEPNTGEVNSLPEKVTPKSETTNFSSLPVDPKATKPSVSVPRTKTSSESACDDVKLPISPQKKKKGFFFRSRSDENGETAAVSPPLMIKKEKKDKNKSNATSPTAANRKDFHAERPPLPIPRQNEPPAKVVTGPYAVVRDVEANRTTELIRQLNIEETVEHKGITCPCGLPLKESQLPDGWRVHRIKEGSETGKIFFQKGKFTSWDLPDEVAAQLDDSQRMFISKVKRNKKGFSNMSTSGLPDKPRSPMTPTKKSGNTLPTAPKPSPSPLEELKNHQLFMKNYTGHSDSVLSSGSGDNSARSVSHGTNSSQSDNQHEAVSRLPSSLPSDCHHELTRDNSYVIKNESENL